MEAGVLAHNWNFYSHFLRAGQQGEKGAQIPWSWFNPQSSHPHKMAPPPYLPLIPCQGKLAPRHLASPCAAPFRVAVRNLRDVSLASHKIFSPCTYLIIPSDIYTNRLTTTKGGRLRQIRLMRPVILIPSRLGVPRRKQMRMWIWMWIQQMRWWCSIFTR